MLILIKYFCTEQAGKMAPPLLAMFSSPVTTILGIVPLFAMGLTYFRYNSVDPESHPLDVQNVSIKFNHNIIS